MGDLTVEQVEAAIGIPAPEWASRCHEISLAIVQMIYPPGMARVARGWCKAVPGQHSWVVLGDDCYADTARIIDPTLWSYTGDAPVIWHGTLGEGIHHPHGQGTIWKWGRPENTRGAPITITSREPWSEIAEDFLDLLGPLDLEGWRILAHAPVEGWPAGEIIAAMYDHPDISNAIPIDIVGMVTDRNPSGLYLREEISAENRNLSKEWSKP